MGLLDADVHGPSVPRMMNLRGQPRTRPGTWSAQSICLLWPAGSRALGVAEAALCNTDKQMIPLENFGVKCMSMGFLMKVTPDAECAGSLPAWKHACCPLLSPTLASVGGRGSCLARAHGHECNSDIRASNTLGEAGCLSHRHAARHRQGSVHCNRLSTAHDLGAFVLLLGVLTCAATYLQLVH